MAENRDPSTPSANFRKMIGSRAKINTVLSGTEALRDARETYLPKHESEKDKTYEERRTGATLLNISKLTLDSWVGRPFSDPVTIGDDVPTDVKDEWLEDVDLQGNDVTTFARNWFRSGLASAFSHVLVDAPQRAPGQDTLDDDRRLNTRPYLNFVDPVNLIFAEAQVWRGVEVLTHVRLSEIERRRVGFEEEDTERIRIFDRILEGETPESIVGFSDERLAGTDVDAMLEALKPGVFVTLWEKRKEKAVNEEEWFIIEPTRRLDERMDEIPIVTFYADREDLMLGKSPLEDLVDLNINWFRSRADQNAILTVARFPMLALSGEESEDDGAAETEIGPKRFLRTTEKGKFYWVEHEGKAIAAGRQDLLDLEEQMAHYGAEFLRKRPGNMTATARALDSAEATSPLQDAAHRFNDSLNRALMLMGKWVGRDDIGTLEIATEFGPEEIVQGDLETLKDMNTRSKLSDEDYEQELLRRGVLRDDFDTEKNAERLEGQRQEQGQNGVALQPIDPLAEE